MSLYRGLFAVVVMLSVAILSTGAFAAVPLTLTHQGRLLGADDQPVNGVFDITYRVFEAPSGGAPLWTEVHASVQVADGLFSALLGSTVPLSADVFGGGGSGGALAPPRYLEVAVSGTALTPRLALSSVPSALSSSRVTGDIETLPGLIVIGDPLTDNHATFGEKVNQGLQAAGSALSQGATRITNDCDGSSASQVMEKKGLNAVNVKLARTISSPPGGPLAIDALDMDSDDDGVMDRSISSSLDAAGARLKVTNIGSSGQDGVSLSALPTTSSVAINTKGTGADKNRITSTTNPEVATTLLEADLDGDGVMDVTSADSVGTIGASRRLAVHNLGSSGEDGVEVRLLVRPGKGDVKITASQNSQSLRCSSSADSAAATMLIDADLDGDGLADRSISSSCDATSARLKVNNIGSSGNDGVELSVLPTTSSMAIKTKGTGAAHNRTATVSSSTDESNASVVCDIDDDGDGVPESEISQFLTPATSSMAIKTKGTGAAHGRSITSATDIESASVFLAADLDGDGVSDNSVSQSSGDGGAQLTVAVDGSHRGHVTVLKGPVVMTDMDSDGNAYFASKLGIGVLTPSEKLEVAGGAYCDGTNWVNASDVNSKENFQPVNNAELLEKISELSITKWNYKGDSETEHIGPTAQDFRAAFGVGANDKSISTIDPSGIALAAIKALNSKMQELNAKTSQLENQAREITQLKAELDAIKAMLQKQASSKN